MAEMKLLGFTAWGRFQLDGMEKHTDFLFHVRLQLIKGDDDINEIPSQNVKELESSG